MIQTFGLSHIQIAVRDLEKSVWFNQEIFWHEGIIQGWCKLRDAQTPVSQEAFTLNDRSDLQKEAGELASVQHFGFRQQRHREQQPQLTGSGNDK